tara:strand:- start:114 stop:266 length:153 start_codon:yes stop_codon:yes gene_type:complete
MSSKPVQINVNIHSKLKAISDKRKEDGRHDYPMSQILGELISKQHSKDFK